MYETFEVRNVFYIRVCDECYVNSGKEGLKMDKKNESIIWSDNWWIEGMYAWFVPGEDNILLMADFEKREISLVDRLPIKKTGFRMYPRCIKSKQYIFCLPTYEKDIFRYDCKNKRWKKISLSCENEKKAMITDFAVRKNKLYVVSKGLLKIIIINIEEGIVTDEYKIGKKGEVIGRSVFTNDYIYISSSFYPLIYEFDIHTNKINQFQVNGLNDIINTLCFDGDAFWISGRKRTVYSWKKKNNKIDTFKNFPNMFGEYNFSESYDQLLNIESEKYMFPIFLESIAVGGFVWFIPYKTNKILYIGKKDDHIREFVVDEEINNQSELKQCLMSAMYLLLYVREERYIGIYSLKNESILEIDAKRMSYQTLKFGFDEDVMKLFLNKTMNENRKADIRIFRLLLGGHLEKWKNDNVGNLIYQIIKDKG